MWIYGENQDRCTVCVPHRAHRPPAESREVHDINEEDSHVIQGGVDADPLLDAITELPPTTRCRTLSAESDASQESELDSRDRASSLTSQGFYFSISSFNPN